MAVVVAILYFALFIVQASAFFEGVEHGLGWGGLGQVLSLIGCMFLGPLGTMIVTGFAFYGAYSGWHWPLWQAFLLAFPGLVLMVLALGFGGLNAVSEKLRR